MLRSFLIRILIGALLVGLANVAQALEVVLPAPRLLTVMPMGGQVGTTVEVTITGESIDGANELYFSTPKITAQAVTKADGEVVPNKFSVTIAPDAPCGVHEARVMTRLGVSASRAFSVGALPEVVREKPNNSPETAMALALDSVCNATTTSRLLDFYTFTAVKGKRVVVDCAAAGIDSKLTPVVIVSDAQRRDLLVNRTGGMLEFTPPADGSYFVKIYSLTFKGGPEQFYRLALRNEQAEGTVARLPSTRTVSAASWVPEIPSNLPQVAEVEPNNGPADAQKITLPCEIAGRFFPAADVDTFEFNAKQGEIWWCEVVSERLGLPTDPFVVVQRVTQEAGREKLVDVAEFNDIPSPIKVSTGNFGYDGPPFDAGSADSLGKIEIKEDGVYRLQVRDLFGGTRAEPSHVYRLLLRKAAPDFACVGWAMHMSLRNGDRSALSKPAALRGGATVAWQVAVVRKDGFDGEIELTMEDLPVAVTACGLKIPPGKTIGTMLITAAEDAPRSLGIARLVGRAEIDGRTVTHTGQVASVEWPVRDAAQEIPAPRLLADFPVSVGAEAAPVTICPGEDKVWEAAAGEKLTIPLKTLWRGELTGPIKLKALGNGFEGVKEFDLVNKAAFSEAVLDLAALKTPPGDYTLAFYGPGVVKYRDNLDAIKVVEAEQKQVEQEAYAMTSQAKQLAEEAKAAPEERKAEAEAAAKAAEEKSKAMEVMKADVTKRMKAATEAAAPKDIVDIMVSEPIRIRIKPVETK